MKNYRVLFLKSTLPVFLLFNCGGGDSSVPEPLTGLPAPIELTWEDLKKATTEEFAAVVIEGYIGNNGSDEINMGGDHTLELYERRNQSSGTVLHVYIQFGEDPNMAAPLPENYTADDYKIYCDDLTTVTSGQKVRVTLNLNSYTGNDIFSGIGTKIESLESDFDSTIFKTAIVLTDEIVADTADKSVYCYLTGNLAMPNLVSSYGNEISLDLKDSPVKAVTSVAVPLSDHRPSTMNEIPQDCIEKDFVVRDYKGQLIQPGTTLKLYGTWYSFTYEGQKTSMFNLEEIVKN